MHSPSLLDHKCEVSRQLMKRFQRKHLIFFFNPIWPPNHITYHLEINKLVQACLGEHVCKVLPQSVQPFWRRKLLKKPSKIFSEVVEQIEAKLYTYDRLSMRNKRFTDVRSHGLAAILDLP